MLWVPVSAGDRNSREGNRSLHRALQFELSVDVRGGGRPSCLTVAVRCSTDKQEDLSDGFRNQHHGHWRVMVDRHDEAEEACWILRSRNAKMWRLVRGLAK